MQGAGVIVLAIGAAFAMNWLYQVERKPSELLFAAGGGLAKTPLETWRSYAPLFRRYAAGSITPELLAALAQSEAAGNPLARTYWKWSWSLDPTKVYRPASTSVGMYQMTDADFADARRLCVHDHRVLSAQRGNACWRTLPPRRIAAGDAIEMTSAVLDVQLESILARQHLSGASVEHKRHLATLVHLCGVGPAARYARDGFRFRGGSRCGEHDAQGYLNRVDALEREFRRLSRAEL
ncbi:MAG: transglycosylase SLT domain-containing protein [Steroidobacteraceae bacterium]